jgi:hypothetical protein
MKPRERKPKPGILPAIPAGTRQAVNAADARAKTAAFVKVVKHKFTID